MCQAVVETWLGGFSEAMNIDGPVRCNLFGPGRRDVVEILLEEGMDPNCFDGTSGWHNGLQNILFMCSHGMITSIHRMTYMSIHVYLIG